RPCLSRRDRSRLQSASTSRAPNPLPLDRLPLNGSDSKLNEFQSLYPSWSCKFPSHRCDTSHRQRLARCADQRLQILPLLHAMSCMPCAPSRSNTHDGSSPSRIRPRQTHQQRPTSHRALGSEKYSLQKRISSFPNNAPAKPARRDLPLPAAPRPFAGQLLPVLPPSARRSSCAVPVVQDA